MPFIFKVPQSGSKMALAKDIFSTTAVVLMVLSVSHHSVASGEPVREYRPPEMDDEDGKEKSNKEAVMNLAAEVAALKTMLASVQGSLITSVGILQDQVTCLRIYLSMNDITSR